MAYLGGLTHIVSKLAKLEKMSDFTFSGWWHKNIFGTLFSFMCIGGVGTAVILSGNVVDYGEAFLFGYTIDSFMKNVSRLKG